MIAFIWIKIGSSSSSNSSHKSFEKDYTIVFSVKKKRRTFSEKNLLFRQKIEIRIHEIEQEKNHGIEYRKENSVIQKLFLSNCNILTLCMCCVLATAATISYKKEFLFIEQKNRSKIWRIYKSSEILASCYFLFSRIKLNIQI